MQSAEADLSALFLFFTNSGNVSDVVRQFSVLCKKWKHEQNEMRRRKANVREGFCQ